LAGPALSAAAGFLLFCAGGGRLNCRAGGFQHGFLSLRPGGGRIAAISSLKNRILPVYWQQAQARFKYSLTALVNLYVQTAAARLCRLAQKPRSRHK